MATAGHDFGPYRERLTRAGHRRSITSKCVDETFTAQAFITTDLDDNQITAFHPGAMQHAHLNRVADAGSGCGRRDRGAGRPAGHDRARGAVRRRRASPSFSTRARACRCSAPTELKTFIPQARWVAVNDYEWGMLQQKTGFTAADVAAQVEALIVTRGAEGSHIHTKGAHFRRSLRQAASRGRSHGLRGCLSRWSNSRPAAGAWIGKPPAGWPR